MLKFFQLLYEYQKIKHDMKMTYLKAKSEFEVWVYERKLELWSNKIKKQQCPTPQK